MTTVMQKKYILLQQYHVQDDKDNIGFEAEKDFYYGTKVNVVK